jgi:hypothetical protein
MASPPYTSQTVGGLFYLLTGMVNDRIASGTASSGHTNLIDATAGSGLARFDSDTDARILDKLITIYAGTRAGETVRLNSYTASDFSAVPLPAFSGALGTDSKYVLHFLWDFREYLEALRSAQRMLTWDRRLQMGILSDPEPYRHIMLGNALLNPTFDLYTTTNVPDSWADANSTLTQQTTITYGGARRSLKIVTDGSNIGTVTQSLSEVGRYKGQTIECWAWVYATVSSQVFLNITDGGTASKSTLHGGTGWEKLDVSYAVTDDASELTASVRTTTAGSAITFYIQAVYIPKMPANDHNYALDGDIGLVVLHPTMRISRNPFGDNGDSGVNDFDIPVPADKWAVTHEATRGIRLNVAHHYDGHVLEFIGHAAHTELTAVATTWAGPIDAILEVAAAILMAGRISPQATTVSVANARLNALLAYGVHVPGAKQVEMVI